MTTFDDQDIGSEQFGLIVIGMQEATWGAGKKENFNESNQQEMNETYQTQFEEGLTEDSYKRVDTIQAKVKEDIYLAAVEGTDTVTLQKMIKMTLGDDYSLIKKEQRGQMRLFVWALKDVALCIQNIKVTGANTGVGNVLANKGGIVLSMDYQETRLTFLTAHLAAHEGDHYYKVIVHKHTQCVLLYFDFSSNCFVKLFSVTL